MPCVLGHFPHLGWWEREPLLALGEPPGLLSLLFSLVIFPGKFFTCTRSLVVSQGQIFSVVSLRNFLLALQLSSLRDSAP